MSLPASDTLIGGGTALANPPWTNTEVGNITATSLGGDVDAATSNCIAIWNADTFGNDQSSELGIPTGLTGPTDTYAGLILRSDGQPLSAATFYIFVTDGTSDSHIDKVIAGVPTTLATDNTIAVASGDTIKADVVGTLITAYVNGTSVLTATDASIASGSPGILLEARFGSGFLGVGPWTGDATSGGGPPAGTHIVSGRGSVSISSPAWLSTAITGRGVVQTNGQAEPPNWYHVGMLSWGTVANGTIVAYPVSRDLDLVELPAGMDTLWYAFAAGVTATIVELASP